MKLTNLLPKSEKKELRLRLFSKQLISFWIWIFVTMLIFYALTWTARFYLLQQKTEIESDIAISENVLKSSDNEELKERVSVLNEQIGQIKTLNNQHYYWSGALVELGNLLATDIKVDLLSLDRTSGKVEIHGVAASRESVLKFWADIHKSPYFKNINFPLANLERAQNDNFSYTFYINPERLKQQ